MPEEGRSSFDPVANGVKYGEQCHSSPYSNKWRHNIDISDVPTVLQGEAGAASASCGIVQGRDDAPTPCIWYIPKWSNSSRWGGAAALGMWWCCLIPQCIPRAVTPQSYSSDWHKGLCVHLVLENRNIHLYPIPIKETDQNN